jgi:uncharacterized protein YjlB
MAWMICTCFKPGVYARNNILMSGEKFTLMKSLEEATAAIQQINITRYTLTDDGQFPNNGLLPLLVYQRVLEITDGKTVEALFESNGWVNAWQDGIYDFHHYHSITHEVLGVIAGMARVQFGGPSGIVHELNEGDVVIIPAGVSHKCIEADDNFKVVGAYPEGHDYDMKYGRADERPEADQNIKAVALPKTDPVYGMNGPLLKNWAS